MKKYITTPIFYANGDLHAGHLYATLIANVLSQHYKDKGYTVKMLTGMDEHGEKIEETAKKNGKSPQQLVDELSISWKNQLANLNLEYDIFLRTTSEEHKQNVQDILNYCYEKGDIYFGEYTGYYCIGCEAYLTSTQMDDNFNCLDHKRPTEKRTERNYLFKTTKYKKQILELLKADKITKNFKYKNELIQICEEMTSDLSISRPKTRLTWGIELPFDKEHVSYVWFDALPNYLTGLGGFKKIKENHELNEYWENCTHIVGKEITRFHGIIWPAILLSLGLKIPELAISGFINTDGFKMSKSLNNSIAIYSFGRDTFANTVLRANYGDDMEASIKMVIEKHNADLANGIGNLLARSLGMVEKYFNKTIPKFYPHIFTDIEINIANYAQSIVKMIEKDFEEYQIANVLNKLWQLISMTDKYISDNKPWLIAKENTEESTQKLANVLSHTIASLRMIGLLGHAIFPQKMTELLVSIGENNIKSGEYFIKANNYYDIKSGHVFNEIPKLYLRIETNDEHKNIKNEQKIDLSQPIEKEPQNVVEGLSKINIDDFAKIDLRIATIIQAEYVEGSNKLLQLKASVGNLGIFNIFAGIKQWIKPEDIVKRKVIIVANLQARKMKFGTSEGMLIATETANNTISPIFVSDELIEGSKLS